MLECVVNISEGRDERRIAAIAAAAGGDLLAGHTAAHHHRSVLTLVGQDAPRAVATAAVESLDVTVHQGEHPRIGVVDVVPFVPRGQASFDDARAARDEFARWVAGELGVPAFAYGPGRTLPEVRRGAFDGIAPDFGPTRPHPTAGAVAVGARDVLVAYNLWIGEDLETARDIARAIRGPTVRTLGLDLGGRAQVSMNLVHPTETGPADVFDLVAEQATSERAELVGLVPAAVLEAIDPARWSELDLDKTRTIEARVSTRDPDRRV